MADIEILSLLPDELAETLDGWLTSRGEPGYRSGQIIAGIYDRKVEEWGEMTDLPLELRGELERSFRFPSLSLAEWRESSDGTEKLLWTLADGEAIESVLIPTPGRDTLCVSSQAGCALRCTFCATGQFGYRRNLTSGEIVDQARRLMRRRQAVPHGVNVVFMGMGEPLLNWENVSTALRILIDPRGLDIGARRITVSTVGVPARIVELGETFPQVRLALSLHAATDQLRSGIVPLNRRYPLREVLAACRLWIEATGKRLSFEYIHLPGVNDRPEDVAALAEVLADTPANVNLMRYNPIEGAPYRRPKVQETLRFRDALRRAGGGTVTIRRSRGSDIEGACGQLRLART